MNVLFLNSSSDLYGSSRILIEVVRVYQNEGITPVVVLSGPGPLHDYFLEEGIEVRIQNLGILRRKYVSPLGLVNRLSKSRKAYRFLDKLHAEFKFDLIYSNTLAVIIGAYWAKNNQVPHIWHIHEILLGPAPLIKLLGKLLDGSTASPIVVSNAVKNHWSHRLKIAKPEVIHNGIPYGEFLQEYPNAKSELNLPADKIIITMIGRINPGKGQLFFLEIAKEILKSYPQCHFVLVGDPYPGYEEILEEIESEISVDKLKCNVTNLGLRADIPTILSATDIFVLPSILPDSFPTVVLEAMAAGKPILATKSGGAEEMVIEGETGYLIPIADVDRGVEAIEKLILNEQLRLKMGESGRVRVLESYSLEAFKSKLKNHLWSQLKRK